MLRSFHRDTAYGCLAITNIMTVSLRAGAIRREFEWRFGPLQTVPLAEHMLRVVTDLELPGARCYDPREVGWYRSMFPLPNVRVRRPLAPRRVALPWDARPADRASLRGSAVKRDCAP